MANYTDAVEIEDYLGTTFTAAQEAQAEVVATAITVWIDHRTGRTWQNVSGSVTDEIKRIEGEAVYLEYVPVTAVTAVDVRVRTGGGGPWSALTASQYLLVDPAAGRVEIPGYSNQYDARVDYTNSVTAPASDIAYAATVLAADMLFPTLHPESAGLDSIAVGQNDISMKYATSSHGTEGSSAWLAVRVIDAYRRVVLA